MRRAAGALAIAALAGPVAGCGGDDAGPTGASAAVTSDPVVVAPVGPDIVDRVLGEAGLPAAEAVELPGVEATGYRVDVPGEETIDMWRSLRTRVGEIGYYPVVAGGVVDYGGVTHDELATTLENARFLADDGLTPEAVLASAETIDLTDWWAERSDYLGIAPEELELEELPNWPHDKDEFVTDEDVLSGEPLDQVSILLVPTTAPWEVPAYLLWGGWNDVPESSELVAVFEHWYRSYGAEVVAMTDAVVEMRVARPPSTDEDAGALATEHFIVAPDNVWQGTGDVAGLASAVQDAPVWYFWWD